MVKSQLYYYYRHTLILARLFLSIKNVNFTIREKDLQTNILLNILKIFIILKKYVLNPIQYYIVIRYIELENNLAK